MACEEARQYVAEAVPAGGAHPPPTGHVRPGRFKAFPIEEDHPLLIVFRHIERNPLRAGRLARAEDWPWVE